MIPLFNNSNEALEFGKHASLDQLKELKERREMYLKRAKKAEGQKRIQEALNNHCYAQFDREAMEARGKH